MLTDSQRKQVEERRAGKGTKHIDYALRRYVERELNSLADLKEVLEVLPEEQVKNKITKDHVLHALELTKKIMQIFDPWPIGEHEEGGLKAFKVWGSVISSSPPGKCTIDSASRTASDDEINFHAYLKEYLNKIRFYIDPCIPDPICRDPEYSKLLMEKHIETKQAGSFNAYLDQTGVSETGWMEYEPVMIDISQLKWMRWKPRDLKECVKIRQPPLIREIRLPGKWVTKTSLSNSSTPEEWERFADSLKNQSKLTEEQRLEIKEQLETLRRKRENLSDAFNEIKDAFDEIRDTYSILEHLPKQTTQEIITDDQIFSLLDVSTRLMRRLDYKKIRSIDDEKLIVFREDEKGHLKTLPPSKRDLQRAKKLYKHLYELENFLDIRLFERVAIPGYERPVHYPGGLEDALENQLRGNLKEQQE